MTAKTHKKIYGVKGDYGRIVNVFIKKLGKESRTLFSKYDLSSDEIWGILIDAYREADRVVTDWIPIRTTRRG